MTKQTSNQNITVEHVTLAGQNIIDAMKKMKPSQMRDVCAGALIALGCIIAAQDGNDQDIEAMFNSLIKDLKK